MKIGRVQKLPLAGIMLALVIIFTRVLAIQNIPIIPFVRVSFGPALIVFSSLFLGPVYGSLIGGLSDLLGIVLFPNALFPINPFFILIYTLLGVLPWFLLKLARLFRKPKAVFWTTVAMFALVFLFVSVASFFIKEFEILGGTYAFLWWEKLAIILSVLALSVTSLTALYFVNRHFAPRYKVLPELPSPYELAFVALVSEAVVMLFLNSLAKFYFFEVDFLLIFFAQAVVFFLDVPLNTLVLAGLFLIAGKVYRAHGVSHAQ